jgi:hypothetical protein
MSSHGYKKKIQDLRLSLPSEPARCTTHIINALLARHSYIPVHNLLRRNPQSPCVARTFAKTHEGVNGYEAAPTPDPPTIRKRQPERGNNESIKRHAGDSKASVCSTNKFTGIVTLNGLIYNYP